MKTINLVLVMLTLTACGPATVLNSGCGGEMRLICDAFLGDNTPKADQEDLEALEVRLEETNQALREAEAAIVSGNVEVTYLGDLINLILSNISELEGVSNSLESRVYELEIAYAELSTKITVEEYIDPCGDSHNHYDEVILKMSDGTLLALFQQGQKSFLALLTEGSYQTTDHQGCNFEVSSTNEISW